MHDLRYLVENEDQVRKNFQKRKVDIHIFDKVMELEKKRKKLIQSVEKKRFDLKQFAKKNWATQT